MINESDNTYNGWKNHSTWNVALWINNDEYLYTCAMDWLQLSERAKITKHPYAAFIRYMQLQDDSTPDGIKWLSSCLDYAALNEMMHELTD